MAHLSFFKAFNQILNEIKEAHKNEGGQSK